MGPKTPVTEGDFFRQSLREQINRKRSRGNTPIQ
jgi:hypothetical protein